MDGTSKGNANGPTRPASTGRPVGRLNAVAALAAGALMMTGCGASAPDRQAAPLERVVVEQGRYPDAEDALRRSAFRLGAALTPDPGANQVTSPVSALYALSMLRVGAGTTTAAEMDEVLGLPAAGRDEAMNALMAGLQRFDGDPGTVDEDDPPRTPVLRIANGVFVAEDGKVGEPYLATLAEQYGSGVYPVDFGDPSTRGRIDAWVSEATGGRIEESPLTVDDRTILSLLTTVYFAAAWEEPFDASATTEARFTLAGGTTVDVPTMAGTRTVRYAEGADWRGIDLPYGDGFTMRLVLPAVEAAPAWTGQEFLDIAEAFEVSDAQPVEVSLPTWDHDHDQDLIGLLTALGLEETLGPAPDFQAIMPGAAVAGAAQSATITVGEKGTVAAAVTQITMVETGAPLPPEISIAFDRPFGYQIIHEETGLPVFLGTVADPRS